MAPRISFLAACLLQFILQCSAHEDITHEARPPVVAATWPFVDAVAAAFGRVGDPPSVPYTTAAIDAVVLGASVCEKAQCDGSVGYGGHPDEDGEVALDAMVVDGRDVSVGSVMATSATRNAAALARDVLERTEHSILCGAAGFARQMGHGDDRLRTPESDADWARWRGENKCRPNFWKAGRVFPDPSESCGPYHKLDTLTAHALSHQPDPHHHFLPPNSPHPSHDTISILALDGAGHLAVATSTNGAAFKIPGRVGDAAIPGSGGYADDRAGACGATGDGDVLLRFLPCHHAVLLLERKNPPLHGEDPDRSARLEAILAHVLDHIVSRLGEREAAGLHAGLVLMDRSGHVGGASWGPAGWEFAYTVMRPGWEGPRVFRVENRGP
ncbi:nucleophile aminohydrolase [Hyaloraphidium curvatum]|nr:nucleophile aminohydrolase [Hyaloraphidium curvatum]